MSKKQSTEQRWLVSVQTKLKKYISSPYWDDIHLSKLQFDLVYTIMNTDDVKMLSPSINERITDVLVQSIAEKIDYAKKHAKYR